MRENSRCGPLAGVRRYGIGDNDVTVFLPEGEIVRRQQGRIGLELAKPPPDLLRAAVPGLGRIDALDLQGLWLAGRGDDPALELLEGRRATSHILQRLLETDTERMEHQAIEMETGQVVARRSIPGARSGFPLQRAYSGCVLHNKGAL
jgi:hypothetical protein